MHDLANQSSILQLKIRSVLPNPNLKTKLILGQWLQTTFLIAQSQWAKYPLFLVIWWSHAKYMVPIASAIVLLAISVKRWLQKYFIWKSKYTINKIQWFIRFNFGTTEILQCKCNDKISPSKHFYSSLFLLSRRHVLHVHTSASFSVHLHLCSMSPFVFGDEETVMPHLDKAIPHYHTDTYTLWGCTD